VGQLLALATEAAGGRHCRVRAGPRRPHRFGDADIGWIVSVDSTVCRAHQHAAGARKKGAPDRTEPDDHALGRSRGGLRTKVHLASDSHARARALRVTAGQAGDAPALLIIVQLAGSAEFREEDFVRAGTDADLGPVLQAPPARHPAAADRLGRHIRPGHTRAQDVGDPAQSRTVIHRQAARMPPTPRRTRREQRRDTFPQIIRHKIIRHLGHSAATAFERQALTPNSSRKNQ
jgi:hypothetical protein